MIFVGCEVIPHALPKTTSYTQRTISQKTSPTTCCVLQANEQTLASLNSAVVPAMWCLITVFYVFLWQTYVQTVTDYTSSRYGATSNWSHVCAWPTCKCESSIHIRIDAECRLVYIWMQPSSWWTIQFTLMAAHAQCETAITTTAQAHGHNASSDIPTSCHKHSARWVVINGAFQRFHSWSRWWAVWDGSGIMFSLCLWIEMGRQRVDDSHTDNLLESVLVWLFVAGGG